MKGTTGSSVVTALMKVKGMSRALLNDSMCFRRSEKMHAESQPVIWSVREEEEKRKGARGERCTCPVDSPG
jgi:hypothetical protein